MNKKILIFLTISILISIIILKDLNQIKSKNDFKVDIKAVEKIEIGYLNLNKKVFTTWTKEKNYNEIRNIVDIYNNAKICREDCDTTPCYSMSIYSKNKKIHISITTQGFNYVDVNNKNLRFYNTEFNNFILNNSKSIDIINNLAK